MGATRAPQKEKNKTICKLVEITRDAVPSNISIEFERDASLRAIRVAIFNRNRKGIEEDGIILICYDNGTMGIIPKYHEDIILPTYISKEYF